MLSEFIETKQYHQFVEMCEACQQYRYIAVCYGDAGVGKTLSAKRYTQWDQMERVLLGELSQPVRPEALRVAFYTPEALMGAKSFQQELLQLHWQMNKLATLTPPAVRLQGPIKGNLRVTPLEWDLLVIDEADWLKPLGLDVLRDFYDRSHMGVVLIGMPGIEKRLARYRQFYSRVGFVYQFCVLSAEELRAILVDQWRRKEGEQEVPAEEALDEEALAAIIRITGGNFRSIYRLLQQVERILRINHLSKVTKAVVETARASLLMGRE
jgi:DNA transposition AAA+ family ATPase